MPNQFDVVLLEKPGNEGLTRTNCMDLYDMLKEPEAYPIEIFNPNGESSAQGFITTEAADTIDFDYKDLFDYIKSILGDMNLESDNCCYQFNKLDIYMSR